MKYLPEYYDIYDDQILNYLINTSEQKLIRNICSEKDWVIMEYRNDIFSEENILLHENEEDALYNKIKTSQLKSKSFYYESYHPVIEKSKSIIDEK